MLVPRLVNIGSCFESLILSFFGYVIGTSISVKERRTQEIETAQLFYECDDIGRRPITNKALLTHIGASLKAARVRKGLTQEAAANKLGVHHRMMSKYERGVNVPGLDVLLDLARLFDLNLTSLFSETDQTGREGGKTSCQIGSGFEEITTEEEDLVTIPSAVQHGRFAGRVVLPGSCR